MQTVEIHGSYGNLTVHRTSGFIISREPFDPDEDEYADIAFVDPYTLPEQDSADICAVGFVCEKGHYYQPLQYVPDPRHGIAYLENVARLSYMPGGSPHGTA